MEKVRGEFTDLLQRLETALTRAQVGGADWGQSNKNPRHDKLNWEKKTDDLTYLFIKMCHVTGARKACAQKKLLLLQFSIRAITDFSEN